MIKMRNVHAVIALMLLITGWHRSFWRKVQGFLFDRKWCCYRNADEGVQATDKDTLRLYKIHLQDKINRNSYCLDYRLNKYKASIGDV